MGNNSFVTVRNTIICAKIFMMFLLLQQGATSFAMATSDTGSGARATDIVLAEHDCQSMSGKSVDDPAFHVAKNSNLQQHDSQDCIESGCDDCIGYFAGFTHYRNPVPLYVSSRPVVVHTFIAAALRAPDLLYRPPIPG